MFIKRRPPIYNPTLSNLAPLPDQWLDGSDTTSIDKAGPAPVTNGAAIIEWRTKSGTLRKYQPFLVAGAGGNNTQPTWESNVVGSLGAVRCNGNNRNILGADVLTGMQSLSGRTFVCAFKFLTLIPTFGQGFVTTVPHDTGLASAIQTLMYCDGSVSFRSRRLQADASVETSALTAGGGVQTVSAGEVYIGTGIVNYVAGTIRVLRNGVQAGPALAMASSGTTAALDPYAMSVGGVLQEAPSAHFGNGFMDGYICEILDWFQVLTLDQLVGPHNYMRRKWGVG